MSARSQRLDAPIEYLDLKRNDGRSYHSLDIHVSPSEQVESIINLSLLVYELVDHVVLSSSRNRRTIEVSVGDQGTLAFLDCDRCAVELRKVDVESLLGFLLAVISTAWRPSTTRTSIYDMKHPPMPVSPSMSFP